MMILLGLLPGKIRIFPGRGKEKIDYGSFSRGSECSGMYAEDPRSGDAPVDNPGLEVAYGPEECKDAAEGQAEG
jgi:hypothetical protein